MNKTEILATYQRTARIRWADVDAHGMAHFDAYIRLMEETEYAFLRSRGLSVVLQDDRGTIGFPRISARTSIQKPATFDEVVEIELDLAEIDGKQITYNFRILSDNELLATGAFRVACCRFPENEFPYAIIIPDFIADALNPRHKNSQ